MESVIDNLIFAIESLREDPNHDKIRNCKVALDGIFNGKAKCRNFIYTINTDKVAFGNVVVPTISGDQLNDILISGEPIRFAEYDLELDSKLFDYGLSAEQIVEVLLYNIYHLTNDNTPCVRFRNALDIYFAEHDTQLVINKSVQYQPILMLGFVDTLVQFTNCMYISEDVVSDPFLASLGMDDFKDTLSVLFNQIPGCFNAASIKCCLSTSKRFAHSVIFLYNVCGCCVKMFGDCSAHRMRRFLSTLKSIAVLSILLLSV